MIVSLPFRRRCFCSPPRGGRLFPSSWEITVVLISTHAPAWGGDRPVRRRWKTCPPYFYSRPAWGATVAPIPSGQTGLISTHAPRVGGDTKPRTSSAPTSNFYSRPRVGGDRQRWRGRRLCAISTHAPAWGATCLIQIRANVSLNFYSRPRIGGAHTGAARRRQKPACVVPPHGEPKRALGEPPAHLGLVPLSEEPRAEKRQADSFPPIVSSARKA